MFSPTNIIMYGVPVLVAGCVWWLLPRRFGEVRPAVGFLMYGAPLVVFGLWGMWRWLRGEGGLPIILIIGLLAGGIILSAFWFRERLFFRRYCVFRYKWGAPYGIIAYRQIERCELAGEGLRVLMKNGTSWTVPGLENFDQARDVIFCLRRSGVPLPSAIGLRNRFGV